MTDAERVAADNARNERYLRQLGIYNPTERRNDKVTFIGVGGIGSFAAFGAAKLGVPNITLIDPDHVEVHNQPNQFFGVGDIGSAKVDAMAGYVIADRDFDGNVETYETDLPSDDVPALEGLVISGLDSMEARTNIWNECIRLKPRVTRYIDARLSGEFLIAYAVNPSDMHDIEKYEATLYSDEEGEDLLCTERGIIDVGMQIGSLLVRAMRKHFNGDDIPNITMMNQASYVTTQGAWIGDAPSS